MFCLELLTKDEVELTSTLSSIYIVSVKTVSPVYTHQAYHWQEDTHTNTGTSL